MGKDIMLGFELMLKGMLGIFCVSFILIFILILLNIILKVIHEKDNS